MNRVNHIKLTSPDPQAVATFLTEIVEIPGAVEIPAEHIGPSARWDPAPAVGDQLTMDDILAMRGADGRSGFIVGDGESRQFQIMSADHAAAWAVAIGTKDLDATYERCRLAGYPCTPRTSVPFVGDNVISYFFVRVGGLTFEIMNISAAPQ